MRNSGLSATRCASRAAAVLLSLLSASCVVPGDAPLGTIKGAGTLSVPTLADARRLPSPIPRPPLPVSASDVAGASGGEAAKPLTPSADAGESELGVHRVQAGETVYSIAERYGVDAYALVLLNNLPPPFELGEYQRLAIPGAARTAQPPSVSIARSAPPPPPQRPTWDTTGDNEAETAPRERSTGERKQAASEAIPAAERSIEVATTAGGFIWPVQGRIVSDYGPKGGGRFNDGINIAAPAGTPVRAVEGGVVAYAGNELRGFGSTLLIKHPDGWVSAYAHNQELLVGRGDRVSRGQVIARVGSSGSVDHPQLHFELRRGKKATDPVKHLPQQSVSRQRGRSAG